MEWHKKTGARVVTGEDDLSGDLSSAATFAHASKVRLVSTLALFFFRHEATGLEQFSIEAWIDRDNRSYRRHTSSTSYQSYGRWFMVRFPSHVDILVARGNASTGASSDLTLDVDLDRTIDTTETMVNHYNSCAGTGIGFARQAWILNSFVDSDTVRLERWRSGQHIRARVQAADFSDFKARTFTPFGKAA